jgi:hypothetical protein
VPTDQHDRVLGAPLGGPQRYTTEVEQVEQVGVPELVGQRDREHVERPQRTMRLQRERRDAVLAQALLEVRPGCVRPLGQRPGALVEDLVEDLDPLVGLTDLVGVRVAQQPARAHRSPRLDHLVVLAADVLGRLADPVEQRLEDLPVRRRRERACTGQAMGQAGADRRGGGGRR